jgi:4'-phosphopantetheinyl transferase
MGMSIPLDQFEVSFMPGEPAQVTHVSGEDGDPSSWSLFHLEPLENYIGALAVDGHPDEVKAFTCWGWPVEGHQNPYT